MRHLRGWLAAFLFWVALLFSSEIFHVPVTLAPASYIFAVVVAGAAFVLPRLHKISLHYVTASCIPIYLITKVCLGYPLLGDAVIGTLVELGGVEITLLLAIQVRRGLEAFREAVAELMTSQLGELAQPFETGRSEIYRELWRARHYKRPMALLAISVGNEASWPSLHRLVEEVQREWIKRYLAGRLAQLLAEELKACDIVAQRGEHFLTLLPETDPKEVARLVQKLEAVAMEKLGLELRVGSATFPDQEVTFDGLVERAEAAMLHSPAIHVATGADDAKPELNVVSIRIEGSDPRHVAAGVRTVASMLVNAPGPNGNPPAPPTPAVEGS